MTKATKTTTKATKPAAVKTDPTKATVTVSGGKQVPFDEQANNAAKRDERSARARGEQLKTERYTVAEGHSVRKSGERYMGGQAIDLTAADADRMLAKGIVVKGDGKAAAKAAKAAGNDGQDNIARSTGTIGTETASEADPDSDEAKAAREADEAAAKANDEAQQAGGLPSGAENR